MLTDGEVGQRGEENDIGENGNYRIVNNGRTEGLEPRIELRGIQLEVL